MKAAPVVKLLPETEREKQRFAEGEILNKVSFTLKTCFMSMQSFGLKMLSVEAVFINTYLS